MDFRIADTFTDSLAKLTGEEQKAIKTTAFDLQLNPENPGFSFHKLDRAKDKNFWSVRVSTDIRIIVHKTQSSLLLCYVDHHDKAYHWAERRKLETHPRTGAAQIVEIRERVEEVIVPKYIESTIIKPAKPPLFAKYTDEQLMSYGVPEEWLVDVRAADEDSILELADHLPAEAAEAVLDLAVGKIPSIVEHTEAVTDPFQHPDALRRFRIMANVEELAQALDYPWDKWTVFLHPAQRQWVERSYNGPARISGSAGTGKTIVALHRAVFFARNHSESRVLLTTFSPTLANALRNKLKRLISHEPRLAERLEVHALDVIGQRLYESNFGKCQIATLELIRELLNTASKQLQGHKFSLQFLVSEWEQVVDAWQLSSWEAYRDVKRLGRKTRLPEAQRQLLWSIFAQVQSGLVERRVLTYAAIFTRLAEHFAQQSRYPFDFAVVDEAQDIGIAQLRFLAAIGAERPNALFFAGDLGQRIFQMAFSWKSLGVDIRGRSRSLHINYRTSHQIRAQADQLLGPDISDVDGNVEDRNGTISVFNGPAPSILMLDSPNLEIRAVADWLSQLSTDGIKPHEMGVFVRSEAELDRAISVVKLASLPYIVLDEQVETTTGFISLCTMHLAKGLEFRAVVVMACDDEIIPSQSRIESVADNADLEEVYETERHLLYVACTRARDHLLVTSGDVPSEFVEDLMLTG
ncbi:DNA helicase [Methylomonas lenta]|uniref:DNA 3'-5' helicase n=1 Tax=Methylomonas lenta TaxID=980561 RepID=A0A177NSI3_9GAMM|nr:UvrD-helicase domain-containing protein [Methylomonas lenta]OAI20851.1 DNA helicase [Methylomonas lenta]